MSRCTTIRPIRPICQDGAGSHAVDALDGGTYAFRMVPRHSVVRAFTLLVLVTTMAACVPGIPEASMVRPTVFSVRLPSVEGDPVRIQGRGFGDGADGTRDDTYLVLGARSDCSGGERVMTETWSASRISL
jgi:hypothetical protein